MILSSLSLKKVSKTSFYQHLQLGASTIDSRFETQILFSMFHVVTSLELRVFHTVSPVILYRHRFEGVEEGIVVEAVKLVRVVLKKWRINLDFFANIRMTELLVTSRFNLNLKPCKR